MTRRVLLVCMAPALLCCSCTRTTEARSESAFQAAQQEETKKAETLTETVQTGPETVTTTVEEWAAAPGPSALDESAAAQVSSRNQAAAAHPRPGAESAAAPPILVKRTVTIDQRGPILDTKRQTDKEASSATQTVQSEAKSATKTKIAPALSGYLWGVLAAAAVCGLGWIAWKMSPFSKVF